MSARGFSLIEVLIAAALIMAITGAVAAIVAPIRAVVQRGQMGADMDAGTRATIHQLAADLRQAGGAAAVAPPTAPFARVVPSVVPLRDLESGEVGLPATAIRLSFVPPRAAQGTLAAPALAADAWLQLAIASRCATGGPSCGFRRGQTALLYTAAASRQVTVDAIGAGVVRLAAPLGVQFPPGAVLTELATVTYGVRALGDGSFQLVRISTGGAEQPLLDNVVEFTAQTDTENFLDAAHVSLILRVQAPSVDFRGPAGPLFRRGGTATDSRRWLPDVEVRFVVALRNREVTW